MGKPVRPRIADLAGQKVRVDLHIHTSASDGMLAPRQVVESAKKAGVSIIAITDHDSVSGVDEAKSFGEKIGIEVLPAIELSVLCRGRKIHILGYLVDHNSAELGHYIDQLKDNRLNRAVMILDRLQQAGFNLGIEEVLHESKGGSVSRVHIAMAMARCAKLESFAAAIEYLKESSPYYIEKEMITAKEAIALIKRCHGVPVLAHPVLTGCEDLIPILIEAGIQGIEAAHSAHSPKDVARLTKIADDMGLVSTGGSDWHGPHIGESASIGCMDLGMEAVLRLRQMSEANDIKGCL